MRKPTCRLSVPALFGFLTAFTVLFFPHTLLQAQQIFKTDHFKCYVTFGQPLDVTVGLRDQFGPAAGAFEPALVGGPVRFCNPVEKTTADGVVTPIQNPNNHLKMYLMRPSVLQPHRRVSVRNQFGRQRLLVFNAEVLAVPTQKDTLPGPENLDHFKCYRAYGRSVNKVVTLEDQFHREEQVTVFRPFAFCNPVEKAHGAFVTPIVNPEEHLVCYTITPKKFSTTVRAENQFGLETLQVSDANLLCVPSTKGRVSVIF